MIAMLTVRRRTLSECELWPGTVNPVSGYGTFSPGHATTVYAHRLAWEICHGPIPDGMQIDHMCHQRLCINPQHMRLVTPTENGRDGNTWRWGATGDGDTCRHGHQGTYRRDTNGRPYCRECNRLRRAGERKRAAWPSN